MSLDKMLMQSFYTSKPPLYILGLLLIAFTSAYQPPNTTHRKEATADWDIHVGKDADYQSLTANIGKATPFCIDGKKDIHQIIRKAQSLAKLSKLQDLGLILMNLEQIQKGVKELAEALATIPNLQTLTIRLARQDVPNLKVLSVILQHTPGVKYLNLSANNLDDQAFKMLAPSLKHMPNLQYLNLSDNDMKGRYDCWNDLTNTPHLQTLDLSFNNLGNEGMQALAKTLCSMPHLHNLYIVYNRIGDLGVAYLAEALPEMRSLQALGLSHNEIGNQGIQTLRTTLSQHPLPHLEYVGLNANRFDSQSGKAFGELLSAIPGLQELDISYTHGMGDLWFQAFAKAIKPKALHGLQLLDLIETNMGDSGLTAVIKVLKQTPNLKILRLSDNLVQEKGIKALTKMLYVHPMLRLEQLQVSGNNIKSRGMKTLAKALQANTLPNLQVLFLNGNDISDQGLIALAHSFSCIPYLQKLYIADNHITDKGVKILIEKLTSLPYLNLLDISYNALSNESKSLLIQATRAKVELKNK